MLAIAMAFFTYQFETKGANLLDPLSSDLMALGDR
jgi:hypothetical protein